MAYDPAKHHRRSIRLKDYDYSQAGAYFVTICAQDRAHLFGTVVDGDMRLNDAGRVVEQCWRDIPVHFPQVELDAFVIMPNHVHGIVVITVGAENLPPLPPENLPPPPAQQSQKSFSPTLGSVVRGFKIGVTLWFRANTAVSTIWQRNFYEHIIRNERSRDHIREYIANNPARWSFDRENPESTEPESENAWATERRHG